MTHFEAIELLGEWIAATDELKAAQRAWVDSRSEARFSFGGEPIFFQSDKPSVPLDQRQNAAIERLRAAEAKARFSINTMDGPTRAVHHVLTERKRQVEVEGWSTKHDDEHKSGGMAVAAACYAIGDRTGLRGIIDKQLWAWTGWASSWFKPKDTRSNLVRAGALILAEIERIDRAEAAGEPKVYADFVGNVTMTIGTPSASSTVDPFGVLKTPARDPHRGGSSYEASMLRNLLARIHGDGGHYVEEHGLDKALEDADELVSTWQAGVSGPEAPSVGPHDPLSLKIIVRDGDREAALIDALTQLVDAFFQRGLDYPRMRAVVRFVSDRMESK